MIDVCTARLPSNDYIRLSPACQCPLSCAHIHIKLRYLGRFHSKNLSPDHAIHGILHLKITTASSKIGEMPVLFKFVYNDNLRRTKQSFLPCPKCTSDTDMDNAELL